MKKGRSNAPPPPERTDDSGEILPEYELTDGERGKYAARYAEATNVVLPDPEVAAVLPNSARAF